MASKDEENIRICDRQAVGYSIRYGEDMAKPLAWEYSAPGRPTMPDRSPEPRPGMDFTPRAPI